MILPPRNRPSATSSPFSPTISVDEHLAGLNLAIVPDRLPESISQRLRVESGRLAASVREGARMRRREFLVGAGAALAALPASAATPFRGDMWPPLADKAAFVDWMAKNRGDERVYLERRFDRYREVLAFNDLWTKEDKRAFLLTPREEFVLPQDKDQAYVGHYLDIGFGV